MEKLISELRRLYILPGQQFHEQDAGGEHYFPAGPLTPAVLVEHLSGKRTVALNLVAEEGLARALVLDFDGVAHGHGAEHLEALQRVYRGLVEDLGLPAPAVSVSGRKGFGLWLSLAEPVPVTQARAFLRMLRQAYLAEIPKEEIDLRPDTDKPTKAAQAVAKLPPCLHRGSGLWAAWIKPELAGMFTEEAGLPSEPSLDRQAELLASLHPIALPDFLQAQAKLQGRLRASGKLVPSAESGREPLHPHLDRLAEEQHPPCVAALVERGVPWEMQYNAANLNLWAYCSSRGLEHEQAAQLARQMAEATSEDHPSSKRTVRARVENFTSNREPRAFDCGYARGTQAWREHFGGRQACARCPANPGGLDSDKQTSRTPEVGRLEPTVALDLLAWAWKRREALPQIRRVWPIEYVGEEGRPAPWYELAARAIAAGATSAAFFSELDKHLSGIRIADSERAVWTASASALLDRVVAHAVTDEAGKAALARAQHLERRATLALAVSDALQQGPEVPANAVALKLRGAAEEALKAEAGTGPLAGLRSDLFRGLAADVSEVVPTPFPRLSALLHGGFRGGRLYVLLAPPKAGKSTIASVWLDHAAAQGYPALYVGYEMAREQLVEYALARRLQMNSRKIEQRHLTTEEAEKVAGALEDYLAQEGQHLELWEAGLTTSIADMAAWATRARAATPGKTPLIVIDYLQLASTGIPEIDRHPSETKRVSALAVACKDLARQTGAAVIALSSVTKSAEVESRLVGEIDVTAARDSLAIIHAADGVLTLQTQAQTITEGKGEAKTETTLDPWAFIGTQLRVQGRAQDAITLERALQRMERDFPQGGYGSAIRARLTLLRHRGSTGDVALYYWRAFHAMQEVPLPGMEAVEHDSGDTESSIDVFRKYVEEGVPRVEQESFAFEIEGASVPAETVTPPDTSPEAPYRYITDLVEARDAIGQLQGLVGLDLETTGLSPITAQPRLLQLSDGQGVPLVIDLFEVGGLHALKDALSGITAVAHNAAFDMGFLWHAGVPLRLDCTMLAAHVLIGRRVGLKDLAEQHLGLVLDKTEQAADWSGALSDAQLRYAALDAVAVRRLFPLLQEKMAEEECAGAYGITRDAQAAIVQMELAGMPFEVEKQRDLIATLEAERDRLARELAQALVGRNPSSGPQLAEWLTEQLGGPETERFKAWPKTPKGQLKTGGDDLRQGLAYLPDAAAAVIRDCLLPFKDVEKKLSAFGSGLAGHVSPVTGRIHADYSLAGTVTGRMSCSKPNLQQIPRDKSFRALFAAPQGRAFVIADYSQMELRVAAQIAGEETLLEAYRSGADTHRLTAAMLLDKKPEEVTKEERQLAKAVNFGLLYGQGARGLQEYAASSYGVKITEEQARKYREAWFKAYPAFRDWHAKSKRAAERALEVRTPAGRPRRWASPSEFRATEAYNTPVQGGAAEAMLAALAVLTERLQGLDAKPVAVVHDELIVEAAAEQAQEAARAVEESMMQGFLAVFPEAPTQGLVEAAVASSWAEK